MKKIILLAGLLLSGLTQAQVITATADGAPITEGQTFTVTSLEESAATLTLIATNISDAPIYLKLKVNSIVNANGQDVQFCFGGLCYFSIREGSTVPSNTYLASNVIAPGGTNNAADHFFNQNAGINVGEDVVYNLSFIQVSSTGTELGTLLTFNYRYSTTAGLTNLSALQNMGITVKNTVVNNDLTIQANQNANLEIIGINGQSVKSIDVKAGAQQADLSSLSAGIYFARFTVNGKSSQVRIVKK